MNYPHAQRKKMKDLFRLYQCLLLAVLLLLSSCAAGNNKHLALDYGASYRACFASQVINPKAPEDKTPVEGLPGYIATQIYNDRYISELTKPVRGRSGRGWSSERTRR